MRIHSSYRLPILLLCLVSASANAQESPAPEVRLEPHDGQTQFKIGDPILLDLVFVSRAPGFVVNTNTTPFLPVSDLVQIAPADGWVRSHQINRTQGEDMSAVANLSWNPVRVPILINRTIAFEKPGHYEVKIITDRLRTQATLGQWIVAETCDLCRTTSDVAIDISERDPNEEAALVVALARELEATKNIESEFLNAKPDPSVMRDIEAEPDPEVRLKKLNELVAQRLELNKKKEDARRDAAVRLAYLPGDDALRARVHFLAAEGETGEARPIGPILLDGLPSSRNKQLQLSLLQAAWIDPKIVPTSLLQTTLREAKELIDHETVTDQATVWAVTPEMREVRLREYNDQIDEVIATLPQRSDENRAQTIEFLKKLAVPNQFNQQPANK